MKGTVIKSTGSWYTVMTDNGDIFKCKIKGTFKLKGIKSTNPVAVGDHVDFSYEASDEAGLINKIYDRKNYIIRKSINLSKQTHILAANIDEAFLIATLVAPKTSLGFIDRFLLTAEAFHIPATIVFNKSDLYREELLTYLEGIKAIYEPIGYPCITVSGLHKTNIGGIKERIANKTVLFAGHSGVGKSSLINAIAPALNLKTGQLSVQHSKGMHTTTFAELYQAPDNTKIIDIPGIRDFGIINDFKREEIGHCFPEIRKVMNDCQFNNCLHEHEPKCAVKKAVEEGRIHQWRYYSYLSILHNEDNYN